MDIYQYLAAGHCKLLAGEAMSFNNTLTAPKAEEEEQPKEDPLFMFVDREKSGLSDEALQRGKKQQLKPINRNPLAILSPLGVAPKCRAARGADGADGLEKALTMRDITRLYERAGKYSMQHLKVRGFLLA